MREFVFVLMTFFVLLTPSFSSECLSEKDITVEKVKKIIEPVFFGAKVVSVNKSPVKNLYEVIIESNDRKLPVYIDCSLNFLITGEIIDLEEKKSITRERVKQLAKKMVEEKTAELEKILGKEKVEKLKKALGERFANIKLIDLKKIPKKHLFAYGNPTAKMTVYVVTDPQCPFCAKFDKEMRKVLKDRNDVKFEIFLFPLPRHSYSQKIVQRIVCEESISKKKEILEKSFEAITKNDFSSLKELGKSCEKGRNAIKEHRTFATEIGIRGTPAIIFPYGIMISGWMSADQINQVLDALK